MLERLRARVKNRLSLASEKDKCVGEVEESHMHDDEEWTEDIDAVGATVQCHKCGGFGHYARECPSKGKGKGAKGEGGKSSSKGHWSAPKDGNGSDGQGGGGYKGTCYTCGKVGHMAFECRGGA